MCSSDLGDLVLNNASVALRDLTLSAGSVTGTAAVTVSSNLQQAAGTTLSVGSLNATQELGVMRLDGALSVTDPSGGSGGGGSIGPGGGDGSTLLAAALIGAAAGPVSPPPGLSLSAPSGGLEIGGSLSSPTSLSLSGTGSAGVDNAYGIWLKPGSSLSADGPLSIDGIAGGGVATSEGIGVLLQGNINAQGGLFISGQGGDGLDHNVGVLQSAGASIAVAGSSGLTINGSAVASGGQNRGVELHGLTSVAGAPSTITGYGSAYASGSGNSGVLITGSLSSNYGPTTAISVTGHGGSGSHGLDGVRILGNGMGSAESGSPQISTPNGGIDLSGTGGSVNAPNAAELFGGTGVLLDLAATLEGARITVYGEGAAIDEAFSPAGGSTMVSQGLWVNHRSALLSSGGQALEGVAQIGRAHV